MIKYSESVLNYNFKANTLYNKTDIIEQMFELTSTREKQKIVVGLGSEQYNSLKIIDK